MNFNKKTYFFENNTSGHKTTAKWLIKHNIEIYNEIINHYKNDDISFREKIYLYINDLENPPLCPVCNNRVKPPDTLNKGYSTHCSIACLNKDSEHKEKMEKTCFQKYGVKSHNQIEAVKQKKKETSFKNFGVENPSKNNKIKDKAKQTSIKKYGVDNYIKSNEHKKKFKEKVEKGIEGNVKRMVEKIELKYKTIKFIKHNSTDVDFYCSKCNSNFNIDKRLLESRITLNNYLCTNCNKKLSYSDISNTIKEFLDENNIIYESNNRDYLKGKEIDFYIPNNKLGIETNGIYYHSEKFKDSDYHINKTLLAKKRHIELLHFFENEILDKSDVIFDIIKKKLNLYPLDNINYNLCKIKIIIINHFNFA